MKKRPKWFVVTDGNVFRIKEKVLWFYVFASWEYGVHEFATREEAERMIAEWTRLENQKWVEP